MSISKQKTNFSTLCALLFLSACTVGPNYQKPELNEQPNNWSAQIGQNAKVSTNEISKEWWQQLGDEQLNKLVNEAVENNLDLQIAQANLNRAGAIMGQSRSRLFPSLDAQGNVSRQQLSESAGIPVGPGNPRTQTFYNAGLVSNWEIDIFGGARQGLAAAYARFNGVQEQQRDALLMVVSEVALSYIELRGAQKREQIIQENIALQEKTANLVQRRLDNGDASEFDLARAQALLQTTRAQLPRTQAQTQTLIFRLSVLLGKEPQALQAELAAPAKLPMNPAIVPIGLRSDLLQRRPDVRAAERNLAAQTYDIGARMADLFPRFSITGEIAYQSIGDEDFTDESSQVWRIAPGFSWPIFSANLIRAQIDAEEADAESAALQYEKTVLNALADAESALVNYGQELATRDELQKAMALYKNNVRLSQRRYEGGLDSLLDLIDTEREALNAELELVNSEARTLSNLVRLYKALGGGWQTWM